MQNRSPTELTFLREYPIVLRENPHPCGKEARICMARNPTSTRRRSPYQPSAKLSSVRHKSSHSCDTKLASVWQGIPHLCYKEACIRAALSVHPRGKKALAGAASKPISLRHEVRICPARKPISAQHGSRHPCGKDVRIRVAIRPSIFLASRAVVVKTPCQKVRVTRDVISKRTPEEREVLVRRV